MADDSHSLRKAIVDRLKSSPDVTAIVGERVYAEMSPANPTWPFVRYGFPIATPLRATGWRGSFHELTIHAFAKGDSAEPAYALARAIVAALDESEGAMILTGPAGVITMEWTQTQALRDTAEGSSYHAVIQFDAATAELVD